MNEEITIAITGSTGHIASAVIPLLAAAGYRVKALVHNQLASSWTSSVQPVRGSLSDIPSLDLLVQGCKVVIHCAARISLNSEGDPAVYETNVTGTASILAAARLAGVKRFIQLSSIHAFDQHTPDELLNEESRYCSDKAPRYDQSKRDAQQYVLQHTEDPMEVVVLKPTAVIGPFDFRPSHLGKAVLNMYCGKIPILIRGGFDFCDVRDVASAVVAAIDKGRDRQSYLLSGKWHSLSDLQKIISTIRGDNRRIPVLPVWAGYAGLPFTRLVAAINRLEPLYTKESIMALGNGHKNISSLKAMRELGYNPRPLAETIGDSIAWFKQAGYLK